MRTRNLGVAGAAAVGLGLAISVSAVAGADRAGSRAVTGAHPAAHRIDLGKHFSVLRRALLRATAHASSASVTAFEDDPAFGDMGVQWSAKARATTQHGFTVFAVPARDHLCLVYETATDGAGIACTRAEFAVAHGVAVRVISGNGADTTLVGLVPDGISSVDVESGEDVRAAVRGNAFAAPGGRGPGTVRWHDATGAHTEPLPPSPLG
jgi:hypothetical protein